MDKEGRWKRRWEWSAAERKRLRRFQGMSGSPFACNDDADGRGDLKKGRARIQMIQLRRQADDQPFFSFSAGSLQSRRPIRAQASRASAISLTFVVILSLFDLSSFHAAIPSDGEQASYWVLARSCQSVYTSVHHGQQAKESM